MRRGARGRCLMRALTGAAGRRLGGVDGVCHLGCGHNTVTKLSIGCGAFALAMGGIGNFRDLFTDLFLARASVTSTRPKPSHRYPDIGSDAMARSVCMLLAIASAAASSLRFVEDEFTLIGE